ncbi:GHMP kinase [candidate division KSB1 bacterium]|nr:GHMP kinase [candidate division KSB1 bacterium]
MKLFVPGRICLFGEHSDWAGGYRRINADIELGRALITGTNQGLYADVKPHPDKLIIKAVTEDGEPHGPYELPMDPKALLEEALKGEFFSYAAGVAYQIVTHYQVQGVEIDNYRTDLPVKKGLSSSAAVCVLIARAFNRLYNLKMTIRGEMEYAYMGEITTPSRCGRMDQGCAYGNRPIAMTYDGDRVDVQELKVGKDLYLVIVDLNASKDTMEILRKLNQSYPFADNKIQKSVQNYLGQINLEMTGKAIEALEAGDAKRVGKLMTQAQAEFDKNMQPACPGQLTAPVLHKILEYAPIQPLVFGGKGVGSQGDGTAQFIVKDEAAQKEVIRILKKDLGVSCLDLVIRAARSIRKAVIPAAGFGTRLFPASCAVKKELFPIVDKDGRAKPAIMMIIEDAVQSGIEEIGLIVQEADRPLFESFFCHPPLVSNLNKLSQKDRDYADYILELGSHISFIIQKEQEGFGHAVYCAKEWVGDEPFLLMLGDHLYRSNEDRSCVSQMLDAYEQAGQSVLGMIEVPEQSIERHGAVIGEWTVKNKLLSVTKLVEKPCPNYARENLRMDGLADGQYLAVFGQYVLTPALFDILEARIAENKRDGAEFGLTSALNALRQEEGLTGAIIHGNHFDLDDPVSYLKTLNTLSRADHH